MMCCGQPSRLPIRALALLVLVAAAGACGGDDGSRAAPSTGAPATGDRAAPGPSVATVPAPPDVPAAPSPGCAPGADAGAGVAVPGTADRSLEHAGVTRTWRQLVPPSYDGAAPVPLVVVLHGLSSPADLALQQMAEHAEAHGYLLVAPQGTGPVPHWNIRAASDDADDVGFLRALLDAAGRELCVDTNRVFMAGMSNGAGMTSLAACQLSDVVAAFAPVAGLHGPDTCEPGGRPAPIVAFHGTDDRFLPLGGGFGSAVAFFSDPSVRPYDPGAPTSTAPADPDVYPSPDRRDALAAWARHNGCSSGPERTRVSDEVRHLAYRDCDGDADVELYIVEGGGHTWPGDRVLEGARAIVGASTDDIVANDVMWEFFLAHPLPGS